MVDTSAMKAANTLAKQRLELYQEDCKTATSLVRTAKPKAEARKQSVG